MLKLKHSHHLDFPHITLPSAMTLSPVHDDLDEPTQAIVEDPNTHDDTWTLEERPDMGELTKFWDDVQTDVQNDPEWFTFQDE